MQVDIQLVGKSNHWVYQQRRIRIGRDSSCDISLNTEEFPMVSREHVVLELSNGVLTLSDPRSGNGTFLRGKRVTAGILSSGDTIRLGEDGPELRISLTDVAAQATVVNPQVVTHIPQTATPPMAPPDMATKVVVQTATVAGSSPDAGNTTVVAHSAPGASTIGNPGAGNPGVSNLDAPTVFVSNPGAAATVRASATQSAAPSHPAAQPPPSRSREVRISMGNNPPETPQPKVPAAPIPAKHQSDIEDQQMIEQKLGSIHTLLVVNLVVVLALILGLLYQSQQIERNRKALNDLRMQAQSAVGQFAPELDTRLSSFDKRMDSMDGKMKAEEEHFIQRMNTEIPAMLDKYVDRKLNDAKRQAAVARP